MSKLDPNADSRWMERALRLAARGYTHPNPMVGCVLVKSGETVGQGFHRAAGEPHAEVNALRMAGMAARGATAYVTLEPCAHFGRTPPCTRALIEAGVSRVVAAIADPDSRVAGSGLEELRRAGLEVDVGLLDDRARLLNEAYFHHRLTGRPFVTLKAAMSLDGKIATRTGESKWITGERARQYSHRLRARSGAVLCGIGTALTDDPLLTARIRGIGRQPLRIVLDTHLRLPRDSQIVRTASQFPVIVAVGEEVDREKLGFMEQHQVQILRFLTDKQGRIPIDPLLEELGRREINSLLVEGGSEVHASFLDYRAANKLVWFVAPRIIGGRDAPGPIGGRGAESINMAIRTGKLNVRRLGQDLLVETMPDYLSMGII